MSLKSYLLKEDRIDSILLSLKKLDYLTTSQIRELHDLKSQRNTSRVLNSMATYLSHFREGENIYYLSEEGRKRVNASVIRKKTSHVQHYIMRNQLYLFMKSPTDWLNEPTYEFEELKGVSIHPDASFTNLEGKLCFVEVDNQQKMIENKKKIEMYSKFIAANNWDKEPMVIWVTTTETKRKSIIKEVGMSKVKSRVYTISDII